MIKNVKHWRPGGTAGQLNIGKVEMKMGLKSKLTALLLAMAMVLGLMVPVFAANGQPTQGSVTVLYTNDVHTYIDKDLTYSMVAGYRDSLGENVLLVDAGDHIQGTAYGSMDKGKTIINLMNAAGYDLATLGNHEFDYGMEGAMNAIQWAKFPYVSSNFYHEKNGVKGENVLDSYQILKVGDKSIAFVGITTPESFTKSTPAYFQDDQGNYIYGIAGGNNGAQLYSAVQTAIDAAAAEKPDYIIALGHLGVDAASAPWTSKEVIANTTGLDAFIDGHSHSTIPMEEVKDKNGDAVVLTQTGSYLDALGQMTISANGTITAKLVTAKDMGDITPNQDVKAIEDAWVTDINQRLGQVIGTTKTVFDNYASDGTRLVRSMETNSGDFAADALYYLFDNQGLDVDVAVMNGGGIRNQALTGDISYLTLKQMHTFGNVACLITVTGQQLLDALEWGARGVGTGEEMGGFLQVSGIKFTIDTTIAPTVQSDDKGVWTGGPTSGQYRVKDVVIYDKETRTYVPLDLKAKYNLAGYNYNLRDLGDGFAMYQGSTNVLDYVMEDYMVLANYIQSFSKDKNGLPVVTGYENLYGDGRITINYNDVSHNAWYAGAVRYATTEGIMNGTGNNSFTPAGTVTRGTLATILARHDGVDTTGGDTWYSKGVAWSVEKGVSDGTSPNRSITRQEVVTMLYRYLGSPQTEGDLSKYTDQASVASWARDAMEWAVVVGVIQGTDDLRLNPSGTATRMEMAQIMTNFLQGIQG